MGAPEVERLDLFVVLDLGRRAFLEDPPVVHHRHALGDAERDVHAITVNRWPHGYAYQPELLWEPEYASEEEKPWVLGRAPFGRIAIANSDAGASATTQCAIEQGWRAVQEAL